MEQQITGFYDLTDAAYDIWAGINLDLDTPPTNEDLDDIRRIIKAHYAWTAKRLGQGKTARFDECGTFMLKLRAGREVQDFRTKERYRIPDYLEVEFNASSIMEMLIQQELNLPVPDVK